MAERFAAHLKDLHGPSVSRGPSVEKRCFKLFLCKLVHDNKFSMKEIKALLTVKHYKQSGDLLCYPWIVLKLKTELKRLITGAYASAVIINSTYSSCFSE